MILSHRPARPHIVINRRHVRAQQITTLLMTAVRKHIPWLDTEEADKANAERNLCREIEDQLWCDGAQMITEGDRIRAGLPPRNVDGLTVEELSAIEEQLILAMARPPQMIVSEQEMAEMEKHQSEWMQPGNIVSVPHPNQELVKALETAAYALTRAGQHIAARNALDAVARHKDGSK